MKIKGIEIVGHVPMSPPKAQGGERDGQATLMQRLARGGPLPFKIRSRRTDSGTAPPRGDPPTNAGNAANADSGPNVDGNPASGNSAAGRVPYEIVQVIANHLGGQGMRNFQQASLAFNTMGLRAMDRVVVSSAQQLRNAIASFQQANVPLQNLELRGAWVNDEHLRLLPPTLTTLSLRQAAGVTAAGLGQLPQLLPQLHSFGAIGCHFGRQHVRAIVTHPGLTELRLNGSGVDDEGCRHIAQHPRLATVDLSNNLRITAPGVQQLVGSASLRELALCGNALEPASIHLLARSNIATLNVSNCHLGDQEMQWLAAGRFSSLNISWNPMMTFRGAEHVAGMTGLRELDASHIGFGNAGVAYVSRMQGLRRLDLSANQIGPTGCRYLAATDAQELVLDDNTGIGDRGARKLSAGDGARSLSARNCGIGDDGAAWLAGHRHVERLDLRDNPITDQGKAVLRDPQNARSALFV